ncbi:uncharacterized protein si:ch73-364h19.1 isoform X1 [Gadus morhua]|uniref:uncharacterized protein si:ch73-364h19.1 isoform X1 n=1 Tax=Gadus morhua TaxID=8049 RepID=UPI0011B756E2|nr:uncharacterized protein LOC115534278 isoform X1 [Gadus morhua]
MSTLAGPTGPPALLTPDQFTVIVACGSSLVLFVLIVAMLYVIYRKDPQCCKVPPYRDSHRNLHSPPQYYSSRQALMGSLFLDPDDYTQQDGQLFLVGPPSSYGLPPLAPPLPRLPSYDSVRKSDRQRQIHMMIADRFGLNGPAGTEPPPTYEESVGHSVALPYDILLPVPEAAEPAGATPGGPAPHGETRPLPPGATEGGSDLRLPV